MTRKPLGPSGIGTAGLRTPRSAPVPAATVAQSLPEPSGPSGSAGSSVAAGPAAAASTLLGLSGPGTATLRPRAPAVTATEGIAAPPGRPAPSASAASAAPVKPSVSAAPPAAARLAEPAAGTAWALPGLSGPGTAGLRIGSSAAPTVPKPRGTARETGPTGTGPTGTGLAGGGGLPIAGPAGAYLPLPYLERPWGDGSHPPLYAPATARIDEALGEIVNDRLVAWAREVGIYADQLDKFRAAGFGRLAMLTHADTDDPDMLAVAARMNAAWWAADDYYADETSLGATPTELPPRLALVLSAMDPPPAAGKYTSQLDEVIAADPVLVAIRSATKYMADRATPSQVMRAYLATSQMYVSWAAYAAWRYLQTLPSVWRYLAARQHDSFYTSMTLIDIVGGYQLPANVFYERHFNQALTQAGTAAVLVNDLHSVAREASDELPDGNIVLLLAAEEKIPIKEATARTVALHNDFVRGFETSQRDLMAIPSAELHRFLRGAQAWMAGGIEWHSTSDRYQ